MDDAIKAQNTRARKPLTQERLKEVLHYDPETGKFTRLIATARCLKVGDPAGSVSTFGYLKIGIDGKQYYAHRLAFLYQTGRMPPYVDHRDQNTSDNKWSNLREATRSQNQANRRRQSNNACGFKGVFWSKKDKKWIAKISIYRKSKTLGYFDTVEAAAEAYSVAAVQTFGEFSRTE